MLPVIGFALDHEQIDDLIRDLTGVLDQAAEHEEEAITCFIICDPNPPRLALGTEVHARGEEEARAAFHLVPQPDNLMRGNVFTVGMLGEPDDNAEKMGYGSVGDPDNN